MNRKRSTLMIMSLLAVLSMLLTACGGDAAATATAVPSGSAGTAAEPARRQPAGGKLEMFSWWTTGGEEAGLKAMYALYRRTTRTSRSSTRPSPAPRAPNAKAVLKSRMLGGDPPDAFQVHMGHELTRRLRGRRPGRAARRPLQVARASSTAFPKGVLDIVSGNGTTGPCRSTSTAPTCSGTTRRSSPTTSSQPPADFDDFFKVADALKAKGITALALGDKEPFASAHLFETVLLGTLGADGYKGLWTGATKWDDAKVTDALNTFKKMLGYINSDHAALTWDQANDLLIAGQGRHDHHGRLDRRRLHGQEVHRLRLDQLRPAPRASSTRCPTPSRCPRAPRTARTPSTG